MPKGGASSLTPVYAGLQEDLDDFLKSWLALKTHRFADYKEMFKRRGMVQMFNGRGNSAEIIEFNEYLLVYCLRYIEEYAGLKTLRTFEERLYGLYSLYTFFYLQDAGHVVKIRMDPDAARNFKRFMRILEEKKVYDGLMASLKLIEDRSFKYVAFIPVYDPSCFKRFYTDNIISGVTNCTNINDPLSNVKTLVDSSAFSKMSIIHEEYSKRKEKIGIETPKGTPELKDLQVASREIVERSEKNAQVSVGVDVIISTDYSIEHMGTRGMLRSEIKEKAYGSDLHLTRFRRHRTTTPLEMPTDTFEYQPDVKNETPESEDVPQKKRKMKKRGRKRLGRKLVVTPTIPIRRSERLSKIREHDYVESEDELQMTSEPPTKKAKEVEDVKFEIPSPPASKSPSPILEVVEQPEDVLENDEDDVFMIESPPPTPPLKQKTFQLPDADVIDSQELQSPPLQSSKPPLTVTRISVEDTHEVVISDGEDPFLGLAPTPSPPPIRRKSIIKNKKNSEKSGNHVSFAEKKNGELDNQIHEIPSRHHRFSDDDEDSGTVEVEVQPADFRRQEIGDSAKKVVAIDDSDMFAPLENEEEVRKAMELENCYLSSESDMEIDDDMF